MNIDTIATAISPFVVVSAALLAEISLIGVSCSSVCVGKSDLICSDSFDKLVTPES